MTNFGDLSAIWDGFFHASESVAGIAVFRIVWGGLLLLNGLLLWKDLGLYFGPDGYLPRDGRASDSGHHRFSLFSLLPDTNATVRCLWCLYMLAASLVMVGFCTRASTIVFFVLLISFHHRNPFVYHGGDSVMRLMTFLLIFSPAGSALSIDAWIAGKSFGVREIAPVWPVRLMQIQFVAVYLHAVYWKLHGEKWRDGTAVWFAVNNEAYQKVALPRVLASRTAIMAATWGTLTLQASLGVCLWIDELRYPAIALGILMHMAFDFVLNLQLFSWTMICCYLLFLTAADWHKLLASIG